MGWSAILTSALKLFGALASCFQQKQLINAGEAKGDAKRSSLERERIDRANRARIDADRMRDPFDADSR